MSWFQLDAESVAKRARYSGGKARIPTLGSSLVHGVIGFTLLSLAGFAPWALTGRWFYRNVGEVGLYIVCALVFIGLSGPLLNGLMIRPGSLARFYKLFAVAFIAYSILWIAGWMTLRGHAGSIVGLLAGTIAMGGAMAQAFGARNRFRIIAALFVLNSLGYFIGGVVEGTVMGMDSLSFAGTTVPKRSQAILAKSLWGVLYGMGFGAGLGLAFYFCQEEARALINREGATPNLS